MSLRARIGAASGVAVALAVIAVAVAAYAGTRSNLLGQLDNSLQNLTLQAQGPPPNGGGGRFPGGGAPGGGQPPLFDTGGGDCDHGFGLDHRNGSLGGPVGFYELITPGGQVCLASGETSTIPAGAHARAIAAGGQGHYYTDAQVGSDHLRVLVTGVGQHGALEVGLPLTDVDHSLHSLLLLLLVIGAGGIVLAAALGIGVARTALTPIARFTRRTEAVAAAADPSQRLEVRGRDELARLASTFNRTLDELERSVESQRNLVADASHELRTPIATLRANLQLLRDEGRLPPADRDALREDMITELDELTGLVGDVVELARGRQPSADLHEVRVDLIAAELVERAARRAPGLTFHTAWQPTLVRGESDRIARAITNLLDNARKWSPPDGAVELELRDGALTVRDHGPGFHDEDLPFVFDRFHRAKDARGQPGSGLGLAIVRQAAEAHGGFVQAGNADGGGALLRVSFGPVLALDEEPEQPEQPTHPELATPGESPRV